MPSMIDGSFYGILYQCCHSLITDVCDAVDRSTMSDDFELVFFVLLVHLWFLGKPDFSLCYPAEIERSLILTAIFKSHLALCLRMVSFSLSSSAHSVLLRFKSLFLGV